MNNSTRTQAKKMKETFLRDKHLLEKMTIKEIVLKYGYSMQSARSRLYQLGIKPLPMARAGHDQRDLTPQELEEAKKVVLRGGRGEDIAVLLGISSCRGSKVKTQIVKEIKEAELKASRIPALPKRKNDYHTHYLQGLGRHRTY